jgi:tRNA A37 N6-isopentenylltransferase MiaA
VPHLAASLRGEIALSEAIALGQRDTRAYARRQVIFARRYLAGEAWRWLDSAGDYAA